MTYTWNNKWIWKYESVWCSIEKFKYANELTSKDLGIILNASRERVQIQAFYKSLYFSRNIIDISSVSKILNRDVFNILENDLSLFFDVLHNNLNIEKYVVSKLRYCPKCIEIGYHSIFHQLSFFDHCVFHSTKLKSECPVCKKEEPYIVKYSKSKQAFSCECGYNYISETNYLNLFNLWVNDTYIKDIPGLQLNTSKLIYTSFNWYKNKKFFENENYIENDSIYKLSKNNNIKNLPKIKFNYSKNSYSVHNSKKDTCYNVGKPMIDKYINILKSMSRHIRRHYIKINNINYFSRKKFAFLEREFDYGLYSDNISYSEIDVGLYAYIMWRKEIEGHEDFSTVHEKIRVKGINDTSHILKMNISNTLIYKYIENEFSEYVFNYKNTEEEIFHDFKIMMDSLERISAIILWKHFNNWLDYANYKKQNYPYDKIDFLASIPLDFNSFLIGYYDLHSVAYIIQINDR